jgi:hypothetical protein
LVSGSFSCPYSPTKIAALLCTHKTPIIPRDRYYLCGGPGLLGQEPSSVEGLLPEVCYIKKQLSNGKYNSRWYFPSANPARLKLTLISRDGDLKTAFTLNHNVI